MAKAKILLVAADLMMSEAMSRILVRNGYEVARCTGLDQVNGIIKEFAPKIVIMDGDVPRDEIVALLSHNSIVSSDFSPKFLIISGADDEVELLKAGANDWLKKPYKFPVLLTRMEVLCR